MFRSCSGRAAECARDHLTLHAWPSAKGRSIEKCLLPAGTPGVNVASLRPDLNASVRTRYNSRWCDDRRGCAAR
ncbi:hypothetical protein BLAT2472_100014 [Burkholderia latens]